MTCTQRLTHLIQRAVALDAAAAIEHQHTGIRRYVLVQLGNAALAENDAGRVVEIEFKHAVPVSHQRVVMAESGQPGPAGYIGWRSVQVPARG